MTSSFVLASFGTSTYAGNHAVRSDYPLACDRSERFKRSLVRTSSEPRSLWPCQRIILSIPPIN